MAGKVAGVSVERESGSPAEDPSQDAGGNDEYIPTTTRVAPAGEEEESSQETPTYSFEDFFTIVYMGKFAGQPEPAIQSSFSLDDNIVLVVRIKERLDTSERMYTRIYKGNKLIEDSPAIEILSGEIGLKNPGEKGSYLLKMVVKDSIIFELPFSIE